MDTTTSVVVRAATFNGTPVTEAEFTNVTAGVTSVGSSFFAPDGLNTIDYGGRVNSTAAGFSITVDTFFEPPFVDRTGSLKAGETFSATRTGRRVTKTTGAPVPIPDSTVNFSDRPSITFVGIESVTVPAGTFQACKFTDNTDPSQVVTEWIGVGNGIALKSSQRPPSSSSDVTTELISASINGQAIRP